MATASSLTNVDEALRAAAASGAVPGVVALAADDQGVIYQGAFGKREIGGGANMTFDTVFWLASTTKAVTSVAAMQLVEQGRLDLDAPVGERLPDLSAPQVLEGFGEDGSPRLRPAKRAITLRHLLTHTAGFTYHMWNADRLRYLESQGVPTIIECKKVTLRTPLTHEPGEQWDYGINIDWVGLAVEQESGQSLEDYFRDHIFGPLGMADTGFVIRPDMRSRLASMHSRGADGTLQALPFEIPQQPEFFMGGGGLYGTGPDYLRFLRALLGGGELDGVRILREETVAEMNRNQIGDINVGLLTSAVPFVTNDAEFFPGMVKKWGLGYMINAEDAPTGRSAGSLAWAGLPNNYFWIDPTRRVCGVILTQILPFVDPTVMGLFDAFERGVYQSRPA